MGSDESRRLILARRARFMAATLTGIGVAVACGGGTEDEPKTCLSILIDSGTDRGPQVCLEPPVEDAGKDAEPQVCLSPRPPDAGDAGDAGDGVDGGDGG